MEYLRLEGATWIGGDINNNKKAYLGQVTKNIRMYVREMKSKYSKEYKHFQFDKTIEQKQEEDKENKKNKKKN